jgi:riboflavin biosynthesis pyrimidine reductase
VRALLPSPTTDVDLVQAYAVPTRDAGAPFVRCNMISTLDGATSLQGRSGSLGGEADHRVFQVLRSEADVVLVGAGTVRAEEYVPVVLGEELRVRRVGEGRSPVPPIAVVTASGNLDWSSPFFTRAEARPIVFVPRAALSAVRADGEAVADVVAAGEARVDPRLVLDHLGRAGSRSVLLEGGPALNAEFVHAGLLDELCLTISPRLVAGDGPRVLAGRELVHPLEPEIVHLLEENAFLFYRLALPGE